MIFFDKANKKKAAQRKAEAWWKSHLLVGVKIDYRNCVICDNFIAKGSGFIVSTRDVLESEKYMKEQVKKYSEERGVPQDDAYEEVEDRILKQAAEWLVCYKCIGKFL